MDDESAPPEPYSRLPRAAEGRIVIGVCSGLGRYTGIDPVVYRIGFGLLTVVSGLGVLLYVAAVLLMPADAEADTAAPAEQALHRRFDAGAVLTILAGLLALVTLSAVTGSGLLGFGLSGEAMTVVAVFALVLLVAHARNVKLVEVTRSLPERLQGHPPPPPPAPDLPEPPVSRPAGGGLPPGMVDLATLGQAPAAPRRAPSASRPPAPPPPPPVPPRPRGPRSVLTPVTLLLAMIAAAVAVPVASGYGSVASGQIIAATGLLVVGLGLVAGTLYGRGSGLVTTGAVLSLGLLTTTVVSGMPPGVRVGEVEWRPADAAQLEPTYRLAAGAGRLDLTALRLAPGQRVRVRAELTAGELIVKVPPGARVEADLMTGVGDVTVGPRVIGGPKARFADVLEPERPTADPPVIELWVRGRLGDVEVHRA